MTMKVRALLSLIVVLATMWLASCGHYTCGATFGSSSCTGSGGGLGTGGGNGPTISAANATTLVYYSSGLAAAGFGGTTFLPLTGYTPPTTSGLADQLTIVNKKFLYNPTGGTTLEGFSIDRKTGTLTPVPGSPYTVTGALGTADGAWSDPQGHFLFVGPESGSVIWVYQIDAQTGALTPAPGSPFTGMTTGADIMTVDASGKFLYVGQNSPSAGIAAFSINQTTGALTPILGSPFNLGIAQIHASLTGEFLLGVAQIQDAGSATDQHIHVYSLNAAGVPTAVSGSPFATISAPLDFAISPNGKFVYTFGTTPAGSTAGAIEGYQMDPATGALTALSGSPFSSLPTSLGCYFDQSGADMVCIDTIFPSTKLFVLGASSSTGALTHVADFSTTSGFPFAVTD